MDRWACKNGKIITMVWKLRKNLNPEQEAGKVWIDRRAFLGQLPVSLTKMCSFTICVRVGRLFKATQFLELRASKVVTRRRKGNNEKTDRELWDTPITEHTPKDKSQFKMKKQANMSFRKWKLKPKWQRPPSLSSGPRYLDLSFGCLSSRKGMF